MAKREVYDAAKNDLAGVAWTPGAVQNQRWSLTQVADKLRYTPKDPVSGYPVGNSLQLYKDGKQINHFDISSPEELASYVGKNVAQHLLANPNVAHDVGQMEIGKKGMNQFYDNYFPGAIQKFMQPFGGKVEPVGALSTASSLPMHEQQPGFGDISGLKQIMPIMGMKLTPEMKKLILQKGFYALSPLLAAIMGQQGGQEQK
jgi:hypothetical protein